MSEQKINQLALSQGMAQKVKALAAGIESGNAKIFNHVTPTTAELLKWWFGQDMMDARQGLNFHKGQREAILSVIIAHEVLRAPNLKNLYEQAAPDALLAGNCLSEVASDKHNHPKYCFKMATGTGKTWVMQALIVWQLLNKNALIEQGIEPDDELQRLFTRHFMIVAPGLIVYERLLDALCGKEVGGERKFETSDIFIFADLFIPEIYRESVFNFVRANVCNKAEIGLKTTGNGMIAITNWHLLNDTAVAEDEVPEVISMGADIDPVATVAGVLPLTPGRATGNALDVLDRRYARGNVLDYLAELPELMVFNDEAHHIHEVKKEGETTEVEWQKSLMRIADSKDKRFVQMDFSATPYNDVGGGKNKRKIYFPHIITDFDLKSAMRAGLVKSLVLDKRKEIGALALEFKSERDENGNPTLSEGQRVMLRAGLTKLRKLENEFAAQDDSKHPKMLVVCEDTTVSPLVEKFLIDEGLTQEDVMTVDSGKKAELGEKDWLPIREKLFSVDKHATPRVIVSVLMLREGFDVSNICVIVPLRSAQAQILLEQTIGRGLRLMWREPDYDSIKDENRALLKSGKSPQSMIDVLSIIEHPAFQSFYDDLIADGLAGEDDGEGGGTSTGDMMVAQLREDFAQYDFGIPFILREAEQHREHLPMDLSAIPAFNLMSVAQLKNTLGKGDQFISQDLQTTTLFGDYRIDGAVMNVGGYNDYLTRLTRRISQALQSPLPKGNKIASHIPAPYMQTGQHELTAWLDEYINFYLFGHDFDPLSDENWRVLLLDPVVKHITEKFAHELIAHEQQPITGQAEVRFRYLSEVDKIPMRQKFAIEVGKCIYSHLAYPAHSGGLEKLLIEWAQRDSEVDAFCKINENRHTFARLRYIKEDGLPAFYYPDFLIRTKNKIYMVETKAQSQISHPNVQRKKKAALNWCERINQLEEHQRKGLTWEYVILGGEIVERAINANQRLSEVLPKAKLYNLQVREQYSLL